MIKLNVFLLCFLLSTIFATAQTPEIYPAFHGKSWSANRDRVGLLGSDAKGFYSLFLYTTFELNYYDSKLQSIEDEKIKTKIEKGTGVYYNYFVKNGLYYVFVAKTISSNDNYNTELYGAIINPNKLDEIEWKLVARSNINYYLSYDNLNSNYIFKIHFSKDNSKILIVANTHKEMKNKDLTSYFVLDKKFEITVLNSQLDKIVSKKIDYSNREEQIQFEDFVVSNEGNVFGLFIENNTFDFGIMDLNDETNLSEQIVTIPEIRFQDCNIDFNLEDNLIISGKYVAKEKQYGTYFLKYNLGLEKLSSKLVPYDTDNQNLKIEILAEDETDDSLRIISMVGDHGTFPMSNGGMVLYSYSYYQKVDIPLFRKQGFTQNFNMLIEISFLNDSGILVSTKIIDVKDAFYYDRTNYYQTKHNNVIPIFYNDKMYLFYHHKGRLHLERIENSGESESFYVEGFEQGAKMNTTNFVQQDNYLYFERTKDRDHNLGKLNLEQ